MQAVQNVRSEATDAPQPVSTIAVISVVVRDASKHNSILLGVRQPVGTSGRHPGVLSTFTMRVPQPVLAAAMIAAGLQGDQEFEAGAVLRAPDFDTHEFGVANGFEHISVYLVESMLARKLGLADALVEGRIRGTVTNLGVACDVVEDPTGGFPAERTLMLSYVVDIEHGIELIPLRTVSYDPIEWVDGRSLGNAVRSHDALMLLPDSNPWEVCLHGLCVRSASSFLIF
jgi:hypothetical protein